MIADSTFETLRWERARRRDNPLGSPAGQHNIYFDIIGQATRLRRGQYDVGANADHTVGNMTNVYRNGNK